MLPTSPVTLYFFPATQILNENPAIRVRKTTKSENITKLFANIIDYIFKEPVSPKMLCQATCGFVLKKFTAFKIA